MCVQCKAAARGRKHDKLISIAKKKSWLMKMFVLYIVSCNWKTSHSVVVCFLYGRVRMERMRKIRKKILSYILLIIIIILSHLRRRKTVARNIDYGCELGFTFDYLPPHNSLLHVEFIYLRRESQLGNKVFVVGFSPWRVWRA